MMTCVMTRGSVCCQVGISADIVRNLCGTCDKREPGTPVTTECRQHTPSSAPVQVGNEVYNPSYADPAVVLAMRNIHSALRARHLDASIKVVTPCQMTIFQNTYPPSASSFVGPVQSEARRLLQFLADTGKSGEDRWQLRVG